MESLIFFSPYVDVGKENQEGVLYNLWTNSVRVVLGISLPSISLQGKKVRITGEHLAQGEREVTCKAKRGMGTQRAKEPEGIYRRYGGGWSMRTLCALIFVLFPDEYCVVKCGLFFTLSSWFLRLKTLFVLNVLNQEICVSGYCRLAQKPFLCREKNHVVYN